MSADSRTPKEFSVFVSISRDFCRDRAIVHKDNLSEVYFKEHSTAAHYAGIG
jgi:hypothetical protein